MFAISINVNSVTKSCKIRIAFYEEKKKKIRRIVEIQNIGKEKFSWILYMDNYKENENFFFVIF